MRKFTIGLLLTLTATVAYANCTTSTFTVKGKMTVCTTCCNSGLCNTFCN
jgi:hypothetical protein